MPIILKELVDETAPPKSGEAEASAAVFPATIVLFRLTGMPILLMPPTQVMQVVLVDLLLVTVTLVRFSVPLLRMPPPAKFAVLPLTVEFLSVIVPML